MRIFSKSLSVFVLAVSLFACKETGVQETVTQQEKGKITTRYSADRTTATTFLSGTVTLPAGTYDIVDVAVGANVTLANGAKMNNLVTHVGTTTIGTLSGSFVSIYQTATIEYDVTFTNRGNLYGGNVVVNAGTFTNLGNHYPANLTVKMAGNYNNRLAGFLQATATILFDKDAKMTISNCSKVECNHAQVIGFIPYTGFQFVYGTGSFKANTAYIENSSFTNSVNIKFCCPSITFSGLASTGSATLSCSTTCP